MDYLKYIWFRLKYWYFKRILGRRYLRHRYNRLKLNLFTFDLESSPGFYEARITKIDE